MTADTAPSRTWTLGARATTGVLALVMAVTPWLLLQAHDDIRGTTEQFGQHARVVTGLANIQREVLLLTREIDSLGRGGSLERAGLRRSFLTQHVRVTRGSASPDSPATAALAETTSALGRYDANVRAYERADDEATRAHIAKATHELLADLEIAVKHGYDAEEQRLYGTMVTGLAARARAYRWIAALAAASVALVAIVIATLRRRARSDLERAHAALLVEVDERTAAEAEVRAAEERSRAVVQYSSDMVAVLDNAGVVTYSSPACDRLMGAGASTSHLGTPVVQWVHADDVAQVQTALDRCRADADAPVTVSFRVTDAVGAARHLECTLTNLLDATAVRGIVMNGRDVTERVRHEEQLRHQAFHDPLTGLANRAFFLEELAHTIARLGRTDRVAAVLMVDLDGFKVLNDTLGHAAGDEVLTEAARTLQTCVREGDVVARLGGDEFAILLGDLLDLSEARAVAERIETTLAEPIEVVGTRVPLSASVGIASGSGNSTTADRLMREADVAMYAAKRGGKGRYEVFEASLHRRTIEHLELQSELRDAVGRDQLFVQYQPLVQLDTRRVVGVEALVRWRHPERGLVPPVEFIPLAEETGLIVDVGRFVLTRACAEAKTWSGAPGAPWVSVNVSVGELESKDFVEHVRRVLDATGLPPSSLVLEVTESAVVPDGGATFTALRRLRRLGVRIAVDDFGTGYSSLAHLRRMPLDMLKIDKTFVDGLSAGPEDAAIASAIVRLGRTMHLDVVAEGVEREDQAIALSRLRCGYAQGFLFSPAVDPDDIRGFIAGKAPWIPPAVLPAPDSPHSELVARA